MKKILISFFAILLGCFCANAQTYVKGYYRSNGTFVQGHYRSDRNKTNHDNFSTVGNINPFTNSIGNVPKDYSSQANNYGAGQTIYTGSRGGQYYINSNGNKTYVPKRSETRNTQSSSVITIF